MQMFDPTEEPACGDLIVNYSVVNAFVRQQDKHGNTFPVW